MKLYQRFFLFLVIVCAAWCWTCERNMMAALPELSEDFLMSTPDSLHIGEQTLVLRTYLWRDFMPIIPPGGNSLYGVIKIETVDSSAITFDISSDGLYIIHNHDVWSIHYDDDPPADQQLWRHLKVFRSGPKIEPRVYVDVIVRMNIEGQQHYLRVAKQYINATY